MGQHRIPLPAFLLLITSIASAEEIKIMNIISPAFNHQGMIPAKYTCDGSDVSPPLNWSEIPTNTKSLALIVDDPDAPDPAAPRMTWVHWILYDIPPAAHGLMEGASGRLPPGIREGINDFRRLNRFKLLRTHFRLAFLVESGLECLEAATALADFL